MNMNKYLLSAFGALALIACSSEELPEPSAGSGAESQQPAEMAGEIVVKFDPAVSNMLDELGLAKTRSGAPATRSGIPSVDELLDLLGDCELERVFPVDERTEEKAREAGLHLWYVVRFSENYSVDEVVARFSRLGEVQTATPNRTIQRAYRTDRKAIPLTKEMISRARTRTDGANGYENTPGFATQEEWEQYCPLEKAALDYFVYNAGSPNGPIEGGIPIFSSGNEYAPAAGFPGAADYCVSVNAIAADFTVSTFSNYGTGSDISAPGGDQDYYYEFYDDDHRIGSVGCILSTMPPHVSEGTGYGYMEGTSMACPHVSGVAALGLSYAAKLRKHFTAAEFRKLLVESATPIDEYLVGNKFYYHYVVDLGTTYYKSIPLSQYAGKSGGLVNARALLDAVADRTNGTKVSFPNIYLAIGEENAVTETPARYFDNGESLSYTIRITDSTIASCAFSEDDKSVVFTGLKEGATSATITSSDNQTHSFNITVRKSANGSGWL